MKTSKNWHFSNPWFCSKIGHFSNFFFFDNIGQKNMFYDILEQKNAFLGNKNKKFKKSKNWHFCKGVNPWFSSKTGHFSNLFLFRQYRPRKCVLWYSRTKQRFSRQKNKKLKNSKNWHFFKGVKPWFCSKIGYFSNFFLGNIGQETVFYDILERKNAFLGNKHKKFKKSKNWHFSKGVNPWFCSKYGYFSNLFFRQ